MVAVPTLVEVLFPLGPRQRDALARLDATLDPRQAFLAVHRGIAAALDQVAADAGATRKVRAWLRVEESPPASDLLWAPSPSGLLSGRARAQFLQGYAEAGDLGDAYIHVLEADLRHRLGEHYTPHWLVSRLVQTCRIDGVAADPACGDGRFVVALLDRGVPPEQVWATDLNPLAVMMARINVWLTVGKPKSPPPIAVLWSDYLLDEASASQVPSLLEAIEARHSLPTPSLALGNPPWVAWRNVSDSYRAAISAKMATSRLHHARGWAARVSAGQTDLAHIFVHEAVERVTQSGQVAFVLPRSIFKAPVGPGRLREGISTSGRKYRFAKVWDFNELDPFEKVRTDAVVAFINADEPNTFPVESGTHHGGTDRAGQVRGGRPQRSGQ